MLGFIILFLISFYLVFGIFCICNITDDITLIKQISIIQLFLLLFFLPITIFYFCCWFISYVIFFGFNIIKRFRIFSILYKKYRVPFL